MIGKRCARSSGKRWRKAYQEKGIIGLQQTRKHSKGRPNEKEFSAEEKVKRLESKIKLLEAENELLAKIEMIERGMERK